MSLKNKSEIKELLDKVQSLDIDLIIEFKQKTKKLEFNLMGKIIKISTTDKLEVNLINIPKNIFKNIKLENSKINCWFVLNFYRYYFEASVYKINNIEKANCKIILFFPSIIDFRKTRRSFRVMNDYKSIKNQEKGIIIDISMLGLGFACSGSHHFISKNVSLKVKIPCLLGRDLFYKTILVTGVITRTAEFSKNMKLFGIEFVSLSPINETTIYHYLLSKKNEHLFKKNVLPPVEVVKVDQ